MMFLIVVIVAKVGTWAQYVGIIVVFKDWRDPLCAALKTLHSIAGSGIWAISNDQEKH